MIIAIDGPAGTGKGTIAKLISKRLGYIYVDTGAMYRCVTLKMMNNNVKIDELDKIKDLISSINIEFKNIDDVQHVFLDGEDVTDIIRTPEVSNLVSPVSAIKEIRLKLVEMQREYGKNRNVVMEGRDITTVVFPDADVKIYLTAEMTERARRRYDELLKKNVDITFEQVLRNIKERDELDEKKEFGALKISEDAIVIDSTHLSIEEVYDKAKNIITEKENEKCGG